MKELLKNYELSYELVSKRIVELTSIKKKSDFATICSLDLDRRIRLLYVEQREMREIIEHLSAYIKRSGLNGDT